MDQYNKIKKTYLNWKFKWVLNFVILSNKILNKMFYYFGSNKKNITQYDTDNKWSLLDFMSM